ncbi:MAG: hypothetical protein LBF28_00425 [Rickettsiales bacterium]|jgi:DNA repair exonuclease SbcCD ATPase subunit|nr:hypothetical protein [Rickettsiales bacterium]
MEKENDLINEIKEAWEKSELYKRLKQQKHDGKLSEENLRKELIKIYAETFSFYTESASKMLVLAKEKVAEEKESVTETNESIKSIKAEIETAKKLATEYSDLKEQLQKQQHTDTSLHKDLDRIYFDLSIYSEANQLTEAEEKVKNLKVSVKNYNKKISDITKEKIKANELAAEYTSQKQQESDKRATLDKVTNDLKEIYKDYLNLWSGEQTLNDAQSKVTKLKDSNSDLDNRLATIQQEMLALLPLVEEYKREKSVNNKKSEELSELNTEFYKKSGNRSLDQLKKDIDSIKQENNALDLLKTQIAKDMKEADEKIQELGGLEELKKVNEAELRKLAGKLGITVTAMNRKELTKNMSESMRFRMGEYKAEKVKGKATKEENEKLIKEANKVREEKNKLLEEIDKLKEEQKKLTEEKEQSGKFIAGIQKIAPRVRGGICSNNVKKLKKEIIEYNSK